MNIFEALGNLFSTGAISQADDGSWVGAVWLPNVEHASGVGNGSTPEAAIEAAKEDYNATTEVVVVD